MNELKIHERMLSNISDDYDKSDGTFIYDATKPAAIEFTRIEKDVRGVYGKLDINNLHGDELTRFVYQRTGIKRHQATRATTTVIITGAVGSIIKAGDLVGTDTMGYTIDEDHVIGDTGTIEVGVTCVGYGQVGNTPARTITRFPVAILGLVDVYNPDPVTNGYDAESDDTLRDRYFTKLRNPGKAGNKQHYVEWAKEVVGVGDVHVISRWDGPLTVKVVIVDANYNVADDELIEKVFDHIESERPFGAIVTVVSAEAEEITIDIEIEKKPGFTSDEVTELIETNVSNYLATITLQTDHISYAQLGSVIIETPGVRDYYNYKLNGDTVNVPIDDVSIASVGELNITFTGGDDE